MELDPTRAGAGPDVTISIGVACVFPAREADPMDPGSTVLVEAADKALYAAKSAGRNQVAEFVPHVADLQHENMISDAPAAGTPQAPPGKEA